jgi:recombination protein RecT
MSDLAERVQNATVPDEGGKNLLALVHDMRPAFEQVLPRVMSAERFARVAMTVLRQNPKLMECEARSVLGGFLQAAQLGLEISDVRGQAFLISRKNNKTGDLEATFQLGYKGMIDLAGRGGITVDPHEVAPEDEFDFRYGTEAYLHHSPAWRDKRGLSVAFYAVAEFADEQVGSVVRRRRSQFTVMGRGEMEEFRDRHRSDKRPGNVWETSFDAMGRKTVVRRLLNYLPLPVEAASGIAADDRTVLADPHQIKANPDVQPELEVTDLEPEGGDE